MLDKCFEPNFSCSTHTPAPGSAPNAVMYCNTFCWSAIDADSGVITEVTATEKSAGRKADLNESI